MTTAIPTINVNLTQNCRCKEVIAAIPGVIYATIIDGHMDTCPARPVLILCHIPRSVVMEVRLGECTRGCSTNGPTNPPGLHDQRCRARPIRVVCDIGGETWGESEVIESSIEDASTSLLATDSRIVAACRERWALVKALVTGQPREHNGSAWTGAMVPFFSQRDAVFANLAESARHQMARMAALDRVLKALEPDAQIQNCTEFAIEESFLRGFVARMIDQVGRMS